MKALPPTELIRFRLRSGILLAIYRRNLSPLTLEDVVAIRNQRLDFQKGVAYPVLIVVPRTLRFEKKAIRYLKSPAGMKGIRAAAILLDNWALMQLARLFLNRNNVFPVKIFFKRTDAQSWLADQCQLPGIAGDLFEDLEQLLYMKDNPTSTRTARIPKLSGIQPVEDALTDTERKIVKLILDGKTSQEIAGLLFIDVRTVDKHRQHINKKTGVHNVAGLIRWLVARRKKRA